MNEIKAKQIILIIFASLLTSLAVNLLITPHHLIGGGIAGISILIQYLFSIPSGVMIIILNIPLFFLSVKFLDKDFTILSIIGTVSVSIFLIITKDFSKYFHIDNILLSSIYGGVLHGIGIGLIFSLHGSLGGTDILAVMAKKKYNYEIGQFSFAFNFVLVLISSYFFGINKALYTIITVYLTGLVVDKTIQGLNRKKIIFIVCDRENDIKNTLAKNLERHCTFLYGESPDLNLQRKVIFCVVTLRQIPKAKRIIKNCDNTAFTAIIDASEVEGRGFKNIV